ncbi:MAG: hypothetical protein EOO36_02835 [Cytophagaceae bacterium]|nr:MAG: hypothetical protein EOO36_02835 [Cytophagaceae bacterium]
MMRKNFVGQLAGLAASLALAGCCANNSCNCQDELADALSFRINYTRHRQYVGNVAVSFNASDIDTIRLYRSSRRPTATDTTGFVRQNDSVTVARALTNANANGDTTLVGSGTFLINNAAPFAGNGTTKLTGYNYRIGVIRNRRGNRKPIAIYYLTNVALQGRFEGTGCCTCYQNTGKQYTLTTRLPSGTVAESIDATLTDSVSRVVRLRYAR